MRLLRSHSSLFVIPFLHGHFRSRNLATIPSDDLETSLASYLKENADARSSLEEELGEADRHDEKLSELKENADFQARARKYISLWCSDQKEYLRRYYNKQNIPVLELTPSLERLFTFLDELKPKKFVGTESRFRTILFQLRELYQNINEDPETRIAALKKQRRQIDDEIQQIQETGVVRTFTDVQVQERIEEIVRGRGAFWVSSARWKKTSGPSCRKFTGSRARWKRQKAASWATPLTPMPKCGSPRRGSRSPRSGVSSPRTTTTRLQASHAKS